MRDSERCAIISPQIPHLSFKACCHRQIESDPKQNAPLTRGKPSWCFGWEMVNHSYRRPQFTVGLCHRRFNSLPSVLVCANWSGYFAPQENKHGHHKETCLLPQMRPISALGQKKRYTGNSCFSPTPYHNPNSDKSLLCILVKFTKKTQWRLPITDLLALHVDWL